MFGISIIVCIIGFVVGVLFRLAGALRLGVPLLYCLVVMFFFPGWSTENPQLSMGILLALVGLCVFSWIITLIRKIGEWKAEREIEQWESEAALEELLDKQGYYRP